ncbi:MAG TPA: iron-containing alcohol dehydrogenase, partial [Geminicoccaceae bacterium]|nr:iron-containing alcohol dehydrogenase [Geminicoccaceae bacterium]
MSLISYLTRIHFADGVVEEALAAELDQLGIDRPLIVTDKGVAAAGLVERVKDALPASTTPVVSEGSPTKPSETGAATLAELYRECACDGLIALGGGTIIDLAKIVALLVSHHAPLGAFAAAGGRLGLIRDVLPPVIAIPTTAGSGAEVVGGTGVALANGQTLRLSSPYLIPKVAICDPTLTVSLPRALTAGTGMDALSHCIETFVATAYNPPADGIALDGIARAALYLERAVQDGRDLTARREMMAAALNGALALQKGLGGVHAISHALGALEGYELHHGTLNAVLLPYMLEYNAPAVGDRYAA